jgi:hypothetical protein
VRRQVLIAIILAATPPVAGDALHETTYLHGGEVSTRAVDLDTGGRLRSVRSADASTEYDEYDLLGRLTYGPTGRLIGRKARKKSGSVWALEDRQNILDADSLPADTTFVWDPIVDRLVAIFEAEKSIAAAFPDAGLLRQYVYGDQGYKVKCFAHRLGLGSVCCRT